MDNCYNCLAYNNCLSLALKEGVVRCAYFGAMKKAALDTVDRINSVGLVNTMPEDILKEAIYQMNLRPERRGKFNSEERGE